MPRGSRIITKETIKAMIWERGGTLRMISLNAGLNIDAAAAGLVSPKPAANKAVADFLGVTVHDLWPSWYDQDNLRIKRLQHHQNLPRHSPAVSANSARQI